MNPPAQPDEHRDGRGERLTDGDGDEHGADLLEPVHRRPPADQPLEDEHRDSSPGHIARRVGKRDPSGWKRPERPSASRSPSRTPGHQRNPPRYSTAMPTPVAGQKAPASPVSRSASPPWAAA